MQITRCTLEGLSSARTAFGTFSLPSVPHRSVLVIEFHGEASNSREHFGTFALMRAMVAAGIAAWSPDAIVLDLRGLIYEWGDNMIEVLACGVQPAVAVVVSDLNREGLASLVAQEMFAQPKDWLFESVEEAVSAVDRLLAGVRDA